MNKKILISLSVIAAVAAVVIGGTVAYFSDTETSGGNTFSTGVIDITVRPGWRWSEGWDIKDMKPCETGYINFVIHNPGRNPVNVWKTIKNITTEDKPVNEPECVFGGGDWDGTQCYDGPTSGQYTPKSNLHDWMYYDLSVKVPIADNPDDWYQTIYKDEDKVTVASIKDVFLGMIPAGGEMKVTQSYHLRPDTGNWAQADTMTFDIEIYAEQLTGSLVLENKTGAPDWQIIDDTLSGTLTYNMTGPTFDYTFSGRAPQQDTDYCLIYYADPWPGDGSGGAGRLIGCGKTGSNNRNISFTGSVDLGTDLPHTSDDNHPQGAKVWLVLKSDYSNTNNPGASGEMTRWSPSEYLFETGLITYDDTDN